MKIWEKYIAKQFVYYFLILLSLLTCVDILFYFLNELKYTSSVYTTYDAFYYVLLAAPRKIYEVSAWVTLLAVIITIGQSTKKLELVILRAHGISISKLFLTLLKPLILILLILVIVGEVLGPYTNQIGFRLKNNSVHAKGITKIDNGLWLKQENSFIFIKQAQTVDNFLFVNKFIFDELELKTIVYADNLRNSEHGWELINSETINLLDDKVLLTKNSLKLDPNFIPKTLPVTLDNKYLSRLSGIDLFNFYKNYKLHHLDTNILLIAIFNKINKPLSILAMLFLGLPFGLLAPRKDNLGMQILIGVGVSFVYHICYTTAFSFALLSSFSFPIVLFSPTLFCYLIGLWLCIRIN